MTRNIVLALLIAVLVVFAGCSGGGTSTTTSSAATTSGMTTTTATTAAETTERTTTTATETTTAATTTTTTTTADGSNASVKATLVDGMLKLSHEGGDTFAADKIEVRMAVVNDSKVVFNSTMLQTAFGPGDVAWVYYDDGSLFFSVEERPQEAQSFSGTVIVGMMTESGEEVFSTKIDVENDG